MGANRTSAERTVEQERARQQLIDAVGAWRAATCIGPSLPPGKYWDRPTCVGDNHVEQCPVKLAVDDVLAAHDKVEQLHAG